MNKRVLFLLFSLLVMVHFRSQALIVGSDTQSSIEPFVTFPAADTNNTILAFAWMKNGFALEDATATMTFASAYPVSGVVNLNGGSLHLNQNIMLRDETDLQGLGHVYGNDYMLDVCPCINELPSDTQSFRDITIFLHADTFITSTIVFYGNCTIEGNGETVELEAGAQFIVASGGCLKIKNIMVEGIEGQNIACEDDSARIVLDNMCWDQHGDFVFDTGSLTFVESVIFGGAYEFFYNSELTSTIAKHSSWTISENMALKIGRQTLGGSDPLYFEHSRSALHFDRCTFHTTANGIGLTRGTLMFDHNVTLINDSTSFATGISIGNGVASGDVSVEFNAGAVLKHTGGHVSFNCTNPNFMQTATSGGARLVRNPNSYTYVAKNMVIPDIVIELSSNLVPPLVTAPGVLITYDKVKVVLPGVEFDLHGVQLNAFTYILGGSDYVYFTRGVLPLYLLVQNTNNRLQGNGGLSGLITLADSNAQLICNVTGSISNSIVLNGGAVQLEDNLRLGNNGLLVGPGTMNLGSSILQLPINVSTWNTPMNWMGNRGWMSLGAVATLSQVWSFSGNVAIDGNYNTLTLSGSGALQVLPGSNLTLRHMRLKMVSTDALCCLDDSASITLVDVEVFLDEDFTFTVGKMNFINKVSFSGDYDFVYESKQTSSLAIGAELAFKNGVHLYMGRQSIDGPEPLYFADKTSMIRFNDADLTITNSGWNCMRGTMMVEQTVNFDTVATDTMHGFIMGDGSDLDNDFEMHFGSGCKAIFTNGYFTYNNTAPNKIVPLASSALVSRMAAATFYLPKSLTFPQMSIGIESGGIPINIVEPSAQLLYNQSRIILPDVELGVTGRQVGATTIALEGDGSLAVFNGALQLAITVSGNNNVISGAGSLEQPIIFADASGSLTSMMGGSIGGSIMLNGGTFALADDLLLANDSIIVGPGTVNLGAQALTFGQQKGICDQPLNWSGNGAAVAMRSDVILSSTWTFSGAVELQGNGNVLRLSGDGAIRVESGSSLVLKDVYVIGAHAANISCADETAQLVLNNVTWIQDNHFTFTTGSISFQNTVDFQGSSSFVYESCCTCTIEKNATWIINSGMTLSIGRPVSNGNEPLHFGCVTAELKLDNCTLSVAEHGMQVAYGKVTYYRDVEVEINSTSTANGLILGNGVSDMPMHLELAPGATVHFTKGHLTFNSLYSTAISSRSTTSKILRDTSSYFNLLQNTVLSNISIESGPFSTLVLAPGKTLTFDNCLVIVPNLGAYDLDGLRYNAYTNLLPGNGSIFITKGSLPSYTLVTGSGNRIDGNGTITGGIILSDSSARLTCGVNGSVANNIMLNDGTFTLSADLNLLQNYQIVGPGTVDLSFYRALMAYQDTHWATPLRWQANSGSIHINEEFTLLSTWTITGVCTLEGHGETLFMGTGGQIVVDSNSTLILKDINIEYLAGTNIRCIDDTAVLILEDVRWSQSDDFVFALGALEFKNSVEMVGAHEFLYSSNMTSTVLSQTKLWCDDGFVLRYDPLDQSPGGFDMIDATSIFALDSATLSIGLGGLQLTNGRVQIFGASEIRSDYVIDFDAIVQSIGLTLGNADVDHDCVCVVTNGAQLNIASGALHYNNIGANSWKSLNNLATLYLQPFTTLFVDQTVDIGDGHIVVSDAARVVVANGKQLIGSITAVS